MSKVFYNNAYVIVDTDDKYKAVDYGKVYSNEKLKRWVNNYGNHYKIMNANDYWDGLNNDMRTSKNIRVKTVGELIEKLSSLDNNTPINYGYYAITFENNAVWLMENSWGVPEEEL